MTFIEAAEAVLRQNGRPLHFKKLVEAAIRQQLLSHVGRTPEETMQTQLSNAIRRDPGGTPFVRVAPGVFGLKAYPSVGERPAAGTPKADRSPAPPPRAERGRRGREAAVAAPAAPAAPAGRGRRRGRGKAEPAPAVEPARAAARPAVVPVEGGAESDRHRRRRRRRREEPVPAAAPPAPATVEPDVAMARAAAPAAAPAVAPPPPELAAAPPAPAEAEAEGVAPAEALEPLAPTDLFEEEPPSVSSPATADVGGVSPAPSERPVPPPVERRDRLGPGPRPGEGREDRDRGQAAAPPRAERPVDLSPADAAFEILRAQGDTRPLHARQLVDMALKRRLLRLDAPDPWKPLKAAIVQDSRERLQSGLRPRFRIHGGGLYSLSSRALEAEVLAAERSLAERAEDLRRATRTALARFVGRLNPASFEQFAWLLLDRLGHRDPQLVRRADGTTYVSCTRPQLKLIVALRAGSLDGGAARRAVGDLRTEVQRGASRGGILLVSNHLDEAAVAEARESGPPVSLYGGPQIAELCISRGVGVLRGQVPVDYVDVEFFADLLEG